MMMGVFLVRLPPERWRPAGWDPVGAAQKKIITTANVSAANAVKTPQFWLLWVVLCFNVTAGIGILEKAAPMIIDQPIGNVFKGMWDLTVRYPLQILRGSVLGTVVGALPGAGADIAAWMSYAISKKFSKEPEKFGTGHVEGIVESGAANNSALAGAWIPALVFGIPGDSITAIVIGVLYMKNMNPGPALFVNNPQNIYAVFLLFIIANVIMVPLGYACIKTAKQILRVPRNVLMPMIMLFCVVGAFAINNTAFDVGVMVIAGVVGFVLEQNGVPIAPAILGVVLGGMLEDNFVTSMIKSDGNLFAFFERPVAATLGALTLAVWFLPILMRRLRKLAGV
jgi:TctA family transporter